MSPQNQDAEGEEQFSVHPLIYEGDTVHVYAVNRSLICSARDGGAPTDLRQRCPSRPKGKCPERDIRECRALFPKDCLAKDFLEETLDESDYDKVFAILNLIDLKKGRPFNREKFRDLTNVTYKGKKFLEIKSFQVRIGCFWELGYNLFLTHGFFKKGDDWPPGEIERLKNVYDDYLRIAARIAA